MDLIAKVRPHIATGLEQLRQGYYGAGRFEALHTSRRDRKPDRDPGRRASRYHVRRLIENLREDQRVHCAPSEQPPAVHLKTMPGRIEGDPRPDNVPVPIELNVSQLAEGRGDIVVRQMKRRDKLADGYGIPFCYEA